MKTQDHPYLFFISLSIFTFLFISYGLQIISRVYVSEDNFSEAFKRTAHYASIQFIGAFMLLIPFIINGVICASLAKKKTINPGLFLYFIGTILLGALYFYGYIGAEISLRDQHWTASALSVGLLPFESVPILIVIFIINLFMRRK